MSAGVSVATGLTITQVMASPLAATSPSTVGRYFRLSGQLVLVIATTVIRPSATCFSECRVPARSTNVTSAMRRPIP